MIVELEAHRDERGFFARSFCAQEFADAGIQLQIVQANLSHNPEARTLRGIHSQYPPHEEPKLVQCVRGRLWDVAVDLRPNSPTYGRSVGVELSPDLERLFYIPPGCGHGFITLEDQTDVLYLMGAPFVPETGFGIRWNDPSFDIPWPTKPLLISERDASYPTFGSDLLKLSPANYSTERKS
jgi:dTDP-4-dehydrorhamnose 3,5-epimerase